MPVTKHTYTKSVGSTESYAGNRGKTVLIHAIELFFYMKTPEFRKFHPAFLTPSAMEFLDYIQSRYRKFIAIPSSKHRPFRAGSPSASKPAVQLLRQFIGFIHPDAASRSFKSLLGCLYIVMESLSLYFYIKSYFSAAAASDSEISEYTAPLHWLIEHKMPICMEYRSELVSKLQTFITKIGTIEPSTSWKGMLEIQAQSFIHTFQKQITTDIYNRYFIVPLSFIFTKNGVLYSRELCKDSLIQVVSVCGVVDV
jgi:hypothetical protein